MLGVVLAAGEGRRFGGPKAPFEFEGERLVDRAVRVLREGGCDPVIVVLGAWVGEVPDAQVVVNSDWSEGMGSSLRAGLMSAGAGSGVESAVVTLVDLPGLTPAAVRRLIDRGGESASGAMERGAGSGGGAGLAAATYHGVRGHPVVFGREHWAAVIEAAHADVGARDYLAAHRGDLTLVEVGDIASGDDLDTRP